MGSRNFFDRIFSIEDLRKLINSIISSYNHLYILLHSRELSPYSSTSDILLVSTTKSLLPKTKLASQNSLLHHPLLLPHKRTCDGGFTPRGRRELETKEKKRR